MAQTLENISPEDQQKDFVWREALEEEASLHISAYLGNDKKVQKLLEEQKVDVNAQWARYHRRPWVASGGVRRVSEWMWTNDSHAPGLDKSDLATRVKGDTALHFAVRAGHQRVVETLLKHGARVNIKNNREQTALDAAWPRIHRLRRAHRAHKLRGEREPEREEQARDPEKERYMEEKEETMKIINLLTLHPIKQRLAFVHSMNDYNLDLDVLKKIGEMHLSLHK